MYVFSSFWARPVLGTSRLGGGQPYGGQALWWSGIMSWDNWGNHFFGTVKKIISSGQLRKSFRQDVKKLLSQLSLFSSYNSFS